MKINEEGKNIFPTDEMPYNKELAVEIFNTTKTSLVDDGKETMTWPINFLNACNEILYNHHLSTKDENGD